MNKPEEKDALSDCIDAINVAVEKFDETTVMAACEVIARISKYEIDAEAKLMKDQLAAMASSMAKKVNDPLEGDEWKEGSKE